MCNNTKKEVIDKCQEEDRLMAEDAIEECMN